MCTSNAESSRGPIWNATSTVQRRLYPDVLWRHSNSPEEYSTALRPVNNDCSWRPCPPPPPPSWIKAFYINTESKISLSHYQHIISLKLFTRVHQFRGLCLEILGSHRWHLKWRRGLVVDTRLRDQKIPSLSPCFNRSTFSLWERLFTCISSPHSGEEWVPGNRQWKILSVCQSEALVIWLLLCIAPPGFEKGILVGNGLSGNLCTR